jgi:hypothetical protein
MNTTKVYVVPGQRVRIVGSYSEVCMHMGIAGKPCEIQLLQSQRGYYSAQLWRDGKEFSSPVTTGEAGFYFDSSNNQYYTYEDLGPGNLDPKQVQADITAILDDAVSGPGVTTIDSLGL